MHCMPLWCINTTYLEDNCLQYPFCILALVLQNCWKPLEEERSLPPTDPSAWCIGTGVYRRQLCPFYISYIMDFSLLIYLRYLLCYVLSYYYLHTQHISYINTCGLADHKYTTILQASGHIHITLLCSRWYICHYLAYTPPNHARYITCWHSKVCMIM